MELALAEARSKLVILKDNLPEIDDDLAEVEQHAIAKSDEVQDLESQYSQARLQVDRHASESEFIGNILSSDIAVVCEEASNLM